MRKLLFLFIILILTANCMQRNPIFNLLQPQNNISKTNISPYSYEDYWVFDVIEYKPSWGQFVNNSSYNDIQKIYGPPKGEGTVSGSLDVITLGNAGGYVIVRFNPPILNHPDNIKGYDFIIFGNATWVGGDPNLHFQEPAIVEVMKDENKNGLPDDTWYLLKGSDTIPANFIFITNHRTNTNYKPENKSYYPSKTFFPNYPDMISFKVFLFPPEKTGECSFLIWGYADVTPTLKLGDLSGADGNNDNILTDPEDNPNISPADFYTVPDTPGDAKIDAKSGGGDAFKLEWAVDIETGQSVILDSIDFIKIISTATNLMGVLGEVSPEIDAISRVKRNY